MPGQFFRLETNLPGNLSPLSVPAHVQFVRVVAKRHAHRYLVRLSLFVSPSLSLSLSFRPLPSSSPSIRSSLSFSPPSHLPLFLASSSPWRSFFVQRARFRLSDYSSLFDLARSPPTTSTRLAKRGDRSTELRRRRDATAHCERLVSRMRQRSPFDVFPIS